MGGHRWCASVASLALAGCTSISGFPAPPVPTSVARAEVAPYLAAGALTGCADQATILCRNRLIDARLRAFDIEFAEYERALYREGIGLGVGTDWLVIAINAVASVTSASKPLSAASAGIIGARASYEKQALYNLTLPVMMAQMQAKRKEVLVRIRAGENRDVQQYSVYRALNDLDEYATAGSIPGAVSDMVANAGEQTATAAAELKEIALVAPVPPAVQDRRELIAAAIKAAQPAQQGQFLRLSGATPGSDVTTQSLELLDAATTEPELDTLCVRLRAAMPVQGGC